MNEAKINALKLGLAQTKYIQDFNNWLQSQFESAIQGGEITDYTAFELTRYLTIQTIATKWHELYREYLSEFAGKEDTHNE